MCRLPMTVEENLRKGWGDVTHHTSRVCGVRARRVSSRRRVCVLLRQPHLTTATTRCAVLCVLHPSTLSSSLVSAPPHPTHLTPPRSATSPTTKARRLRLASPRQAEPAIQVQYKRVPVPDDRAWRHPPIRRPVRRRPSHSAQEGVQKRGKHLTQKRPVGRTKGVRAGDGREEAR